MREAIDVCYDRFGRYLNPDITADPILMRNGKEKYRPCVGTCSRTGIEGQIINHVKSDKTVVPTYAKLLWLLAYQNRVDDSPYRLSFGCLAILPNTIVSTIEWAVRHTNKRLPGLQVAENTKEVVRRALSAEHYLFICFGKNIDRVLENELRFSSYGNLEINGEFGLGKPPNGIDLTNQTVDLTLARRLAELNLDWDNVWRYYNLRTKQTRGLTDDEQKELLAIKAGFGEHGPEMLRLSRQISRQDLRLARWLSQ